MWLCHESVYQAIYQPGPMPLFFLTAAGTAPPVPAAQRM